MTELQKRVLTAIIGGSFLIFLIWVSHYGVFFIVTVIALFSFYEFSRLFQIQSFYIVTNLFVLGIFFFCFLFFKSYPFGIVLPFFLLLQLLIYLFRRDIQFVQVGLVLSFGLYLLISSYGFYSWGFHGDESYSPWRPLGLLLLIWTNDTAAYFIGRKWGRHPLYKEVSPKKSWEGFVGGLFCTLLLGHLFTLQLDARTSWFTLAMIVGLGGPIGDLIESKIKREMRIKDSGSLLPGHGGFLDRFDAFFFVNLVWLLVRNGGIFFNV